VTHAPNPGCDPTPFQGDAPFETRASIMGQLVANGSAVTGASFTITNAPAEGAPPNAPRGDVSASTAADGSFRVRMTTFSDIRDDRTPPLHVVVRIETSSYLPAYRDAWLHSGDAVDLGIIKLVARDPAVTNIGPAGGTASDSQNRISVIVPPGALATTVPISITPVVNRDEMPAVLPDNTVTEYGFSLSPSGTTSPLPSACGSPTGVARRRTRPFPPGSTTPIAVAGSTSRRRYGTEVSSSFRPRTSRSTTATGLVEEAAEQAQETDRSLVARLAATSAPRARAA